MSEPDAMRWPKDPDGLSKDSADADHADSENVLESTSDGNREDSGTDILRNDESLTAQGETITPRAEVETHTFLEPIEANGDVEIESFTIDEDDSGLELPEDELLDLTPSADARVISCVESDTSHKVDAELSSISDEKVGVSSEPSADADEESRHVAADDQHTEQASSVEEKVEVTQPLATGDTEEPAVLMVRVPGDERWFPLSEVIVQTTGEVLGEAAAGREIGALGQGQGDLAGRLRNAQGHPPRGGATTRYDDPGDFAEIKSYIEQLDVPVLQVSIETKLVEVNETKAKEYMPQFSVLNLGKQGVNWDNSSLNMRYAQDVDEWRSIFDPAVGGFGSNELTKGATVLNFLSPGETPIAFTLRMLESEGIVNVVNGPMITVENGETADFQIETRLGVSPFGNSLNSSTGTTGATTTEGTTTGNTTSDTGTNTDSGTSGGGYSIPTVTMSVSPNITQLGEIRLEISNLELFDIGAQGFGLLSQSDANGNTVRSIVSDPLSFDLRRRSITTTARVTDGGTIVLGGWTGERSRKDESGVPVLRNIPYLGKLFFNRTSNLTDKTTLLVFLTCHLQKP